MNKTWADLGTPGSAHLSRGMTSERAAPWSAVGLFTGAIIAKDRDVIKDQRER